MDDRLSRVESSVQHLERALEAVEQRLALLERERSSAPAGAVESPADAANWARPRVARDEFVTVLSYIGRTLVALGGAYLLRALTDFAILPRAAGIALGLAYAVYWLILADRAGRDSVAGGESAASGFGRTNAAFHGIVFSVIAFPLLWEATVRFKYLGATTTAAALALVAGLALAVAAHRRLRTLAWIAILSTLPTALALTSATGALLPFSTFLIALGVATLWLGYNPLYWVLLRWPVALTADVMVLALAVRASGRGWSDPPLPVIAVQLLLLTGYLGSIAVRTLVKGRDVIPFEVVQTIAALTVGFGGAVYVATVTGFGAIALAFINLAFGAGCYAVAFVFVARRQGLRRNFYFYTSLALILALVSTNLLLGGAHLAITWAALGVITTWLASRVGRISLNLHGAIYIVAGAVVAGLLTAASDALVGPAAAAWRPFTPAALIVLTAALVCWMMPMSPASESWGAYSRLPRLFVVVALAWSLGGWLVAVLTPALAGTPGPGANAGVVATIRTSILALAALALAWLGSHDRFRESGWLLYPVLIAGGLKLLVEDLPLSRPATLFIALALYGGALIAAPRLAHRRPARQ